MVKQIIEKWYQKLDFPKTYDKAFQILLKFAPTTLSASIHEYDEDAYSPQENLLAYLYYCEQLSKQYEKAGIPEDILLDTLSDIVVWTNTWFSIHNELGLGETKWLKRHLSFCLFRLGRLQFCLGKFEKDYPKHGIAKGDSVMEVHIPEGSKLSFEECTCSFERADAFFVKYFPDFKYRYYSCHSWLLDAELKKILGEESNICRFGTRFEILDRNESDAILKYVFRWDATRANLDKYTQKGTLANTLKELVKKGEIFYESFGIIGK